MNENFTGNFIFIKDVNFCTVLVKGWNKMDSKSKNFKIDCIEN